MTPVTIVKLGGSAITDKNKLYTPNLSIIQQSADQLAKYSEPLIVLHGGGSYAHPLVTRAGLQNGLKQSRQLETVAETELLLDQLSRIVGVSLLRRKKLFVVLRPMSFLATRNGRVSDAFLHPLEKALSLGLTPLIHGDLVFDSTRGVSVVSADQIASFLGTRMNGARVLFGCNVDGVFTDNPGGSLDAHLIETVNQTNAESIVRKLRASQPRDATQSMLGKVREAIRLAENGRESLIFNLTKRGLLEKALSGKLSGCTRFPAWRRK